MSNKIVSFMTHGVRLKYHENICLTSIQHTPNKLPLSIDQQMVWMRSDIFLSQRGFFYVTLLNYGMLLDIHNWSSPRGSETYNNNYVINKTAGALYQCIYPQNSSFSSPEMKSQVNFSDRLASVRPSVCNLFPFSSSSPAPRV